jgi:DNA-binding NarL/FixJ family response regulator
VTRLVIAQFTRVHRQPPPKAVDTLTSRERDVFRLIARGLSNAEIGHELFTTDTTVKTHITRLLQKLHLRDLRAAASAWACRYILRLLYRRATRLSLLPS